MDLDRYSVKRHDKNSQPILVSPVKLIALHPSLKFVICAWGIFAGLAALAADETLDVRGLMTPAELENTGLGKLSSEEIAAFNQWLVRYTARDAGVVKASNKAVKQAAKEKIRARIVGTFEGWDGDTRFHLDNGQVWRQRMQGRWKARMENPEVVIEPNVMGFYRLRVVEKNRSIGVKRLR